MIKEESRQMLPGGLLVCPAFSGVSASPAVSAVVGLPHGLSRSLVFRVFVAVVLIVFVVLGRTQHDLACAVTVRKRQRLQDHVETIA
jgi:hypothetical protein